MGGVGCTGAVKRTQVHRNEWGVSKGANPGCVGAMAHFGRWAEGFSISRILDRGSCGRTDKGVASPLTLIPWTVREL